MQKIKPKGLKFRDSKRRFERKIQILEDAGYRDRKSERERERERNKSKSLKPTESIESRLTWLNSGPTQGERGSNNVQMDMGLTCCEREREREKKFWRSRE